MEHQCGEHRERETEWGVFGTSMEIQGDDQCETGAEKRENECGRRTTSRATVLREQREAFEENQGKDYRRKRISVE